EGSPPDLLPLRAARKLEVDDEAQAAQERAIQSAFHVGGQNCEPAIRLHLLEQVVDFDIRVTVVAVFHLTAFAKERIGFVEEENRSPVLSGVKQTPQILLRLSDVLADHSREINAIQIQPQYVRDHFGGHGFTGTAFAREKRADAQSAAHLLSEAPALVDLGALRHLLRDLLQYTSLGGRQDNVIPRCLGRDPLGERIQLRTSV